MPRRKVYVSKGSSVTTDAGSSRYDDLTLLAVLTGRFEFRDVLGPEGRITGLLSMDISNWWGRGIDTWVSMSSYALLSLTRSGRYETSTLSGVASCLNQWFFQYLIECINVHSIASPADLRAIHLSQYVVWIDARRREANTSFEGARHAWTYLKLLLTQLIEMGEIEIPPKLLFPKSGPPNGNGQSKTTSLTDSEIDRLASGLRADLSDAHHGRIELNGSELVTGRFLVVAMRAGINTTDLLELSRDCLRPGLLPRVMRLVRKKYRAHKDIAKGVRVPNEEEESAPIPLDIVGVIRKTLADTEVLVGEVPKHFMDRIWLYRSEEPERKGHVNTLTYSVLYQNTRRLIERRHILADDGTLLVVNIRRLRKTLGHKVNRITNGDLMAVASVLGNTPEVAGTNYLSINDEIKRDAAKFLNTEYASFVRGQRDVGIPIRVFPAGSVEVNTLDETVVAHCDSLLDGALAPKDGMTHCDKFHMCLGCPSLAVVGEISELWRFFSFQSYLKCELDHHTSIAPYRDRDNFIPQLDEEGVRLREMIDFIDHFTSKSFSKGIIAKARKKLAKGLHPFWRQRIERRVLQRQTSIARSQA